MKFKNIITLSLIGSIAFFSCKKKEDGNQLKPASESFELKEGLTYRNTTLNWKAESNEDFPKFSATFNEKSIGQLD